MKDKLDEYTRIVVHKLFLLRFNLFKNAGQDEIEFLFYDKLSENDKMMLTIYSLVFLKLSYC